MRSLACTVCAYIYVLVWIRTRLLKYISHLFLLTTLINLVELSKWWTSLSSLGSQELCSFWSKLNKHMCSSNTCNVLHLWEFSPGDRNLPRSKQPSWLGYGLKQCFSLQICLSWAILFSNAAVATVLWHWVKCFHLCSLSVLQLLPLQRKGKNWLSSYSGRVLDGSAQHTRWHHMFLPFSI